jgi:Ni/Co efflux regulator RcnB
MHYIPFASTAMRTCMAIAVVTVAMSAHAGKPEWAGQGNGKNKHQQEEQHQQPQQQQQQGGGLNLSINIGFGNQQQRAAQDYYGAQARAGKCPPGLAKKNNGCQPPGQAKQWKKGQALPRDVQYYPVPNELVVRMGVPPAGHKYVRVAGDILLVAVGTMMVVDAIEDLMR